MKAQKKKTSSNLVHDHLTTELLLTSNCNMECSYCIAKKLPCATMSIEDGQRAIDIFIHLVKGASSTEITLTGGEPFLVFSLAKRLICYAEKRMQEQGIDTSFVLKTNGTILNDDIIDFLCVHGLKVIVSIDGIASVHDRHRFTKQHRITHSIVLNNLKTLMRHDIECVASVTVHPDACATLLDNIRQLHEIGIENIDVGPAYGTVNWSEFDIDIFINSLVETTRYIRQVHLAGDKLEVGPIYQSTEHIYDILKNSWGCNAASTNLAFLPNGQIAGCSALAMLVTKYPELIIGDIANGLYKNALNCFLKLAQAGVKRRIRCQKCEGASNCAGGCLAINLSQNGNPFSPPNFYCRIISVLPITWGVIYGQEKLNPIEVEP